MASHCKSAASQKKDVREAAKTGDLPTEAAAPMTSVNSAWLQKLLAESQQFDSDNRKLQLQLVQYATMAQEREKQISALQGIIECLIQGSKSLKIQAVQDKEAESDDNAPMAPTNTTSTSVSYDTATADGAAPSRVAEGGTVTYDVREDGLGERQVTYRGEE